MGTAKQGKDRPAIDFRETVVTDKGTVEANKQPTPAAAQK